MVHSGSHILFESRNKLFQNIDDIHIYILSGEKCRENFFLYSLFFIYLGVLFLLFVSSRSAAARNASIEAESCFTF